MSKCGKLFNSNSVIPLFETKSSARLFLFEILIFLIKLSFKNNDSRPSNKFTFKEVNLFADPLKYLTLLICPRFIESIEFTKNPNILILKDLKHLNF